MRIISLLLILTYFINLPVIAQTNSKFQKKINNYLSKDEVEKAEDYCNQQKSEQDRADCFSFMGDKALEEFEYTRAIQCFQKSNNVKKLHTTLLAALKNGEQEKVDNFLVKKEKDKNPGAKMETINSKAFMPIADLCYKKKDYKNAGYYYQKANVKQLSIECKVLHAINTKDYITVVELSEKEKIGLRNTMEVYKQAADQYFIKGDYSNASKCYKKVGDKERVKLCFQRERDVELSKAFIALKTNKFSFSEKPFVIEKKLRNISKASLTFEKVAADYEQNGNVIEADSWNSFSQHIINLVKTSQNGVYLIREKNDKDGKSLLEEAWKQVNKIADERRLNLTTEQQEPIKVVLKKITLLELSHKTKIEKNATKKLSESGVNQANAIYAFPKVSNAAQKLTDDYFISINAEETPKATAWLIFGIANTMHNKIIKKLKSFISSAKSDSQKLKIDKLILAQQNYHSKQLESTTYLSVNFVPQSWNDYLFQKVLQDTKDKLSLELSDK